jgi:predicted Zn-dependent protease with MMP-like domain
VDALQTARVAYRAGRLHDALEAAQVAAEMRPKDPEAWRLLGAVSRHVGMPAAAEDAFRRAATLAPRSHPAPYRVSRERFGELVAESRSGLSRDAARRLSGVQVKVDDLPPAEVIEGGLAPDALSERLHSPSEALVLYQGNLENRARDEKELAKLVARTLVRA